MSEAVLDSSALLALMLDEPGAERVADVLPGALMSAANYAEVLTKLGERGFPMDQAREAVIGLGVEIVDLDADQALVAASLRPVTRQAGLSLGDRICLALGSRNRSLVLTADKAWLSVEGAGVPTIQYIRTSPT